MQLPTFLERYRYLKLGGRVGLETFGFDRYLNQVFYTSPEWKQLRDFVIVRDSLNQPTPLDLACPDVPIAQDWIDPQTGKIIKSKLRVMVHHMNPITREDIIKRAPVVWDPEFLITTSEVTHNAIHYGDESLLPVNYITIRAPNDTVPWR